MKWVIAVAIVASLYFSPLVVACGGKHPVMSTRKDDGTRLGLFISRSQIEGTESWSPSDGEPPLSVSAAYRMIKDWAPPHYTRFDRVEVREISIIEYGCSLVSDRWYYLFDLKPVIDGDAVWTSGSWAAVLMDATVIGPREY